MNIELMTAARKSRHAHKTMWKNNTATNKGKASK